MVNDAMLNFRTVLHVRALQNRAIISNFSGKHYSFIKAIEGLGVKVSIYNLSQLNLICWLVVPAT